MKLQDYLQAVRECPDNQLSGRLGVGDNQAILTKIPAKDLTRKIQLEFKKLEFKRKFDGVGGEGYEFYYTPGTLVVNITNRKMIIAYPFLGLEDYVKRVEKYYSSSIMFHTEQGKRNYIDGKIMPVHNFRAAALCTEELVQFMIKEKMPFCIPATESCMITDTSKIVYFPDSDEERIMEKLK